MQKSDNVAEDSKKVFARRPGRPRTKISEAAMDELKLGKFVECEHLRLPEKEVRRGWQITGAVSLMLMAMVGLYLLLMLVPEQIFGDGVMSGAAVLSATPWYWLMMELMVLIATVCCVTASVMLLAKRRVPVGVWYVLVVAVVVGMVCASLHRFRLYEQRECYKNYPHIIDMDYACPSVEGELSWVVLKVLLICGLGEVALYLIYRVMKRRALYKAKR